MQRAKAIVDEASRPASKEFVLRELARLRVSTIKGREPAEDFEWTLAVFTDELRVYPADAVREALRARSRAEKLWPTLAELIERLDRLMKPRRALREALARGYRKPEPKPPPPSEQDIPEVRDLLVANGLSTPRGPRERPLEHTWPTRAQRAAVDEETAHRRVTRIVDVSDDDPRLQAWLKEMGASTRSAAE
jgi:hypothetical protein